MSLNLISENNRENKRRRIDSSFDEHSSSSSSSSSLSVPKTIPSAVEQLKTMIENDTLLSLPILLNDKEIVVKDLRVALDYAVQLDRVSAVRVLFNDQRIVDSPTSVNAVWKMARAYNSRRTIRFLLPFVSTTFTDVLDFEIVRSLAIEFDDVSLLIEVGRAMDRCSLFTKDARAQYDANAFERALHRRSVDAARYLIVERKFDVLASNALFHASAMYDHGSFVRMIFHCTKKFDESTFMDALSTYCVDTVRVLLQDQQMIKWLHSNDDAGGRFATLADKLDHVLNAVKSYGAPMLKLLLRNSVRLVQHVRDRDYFSDYDRAESICVELLAVCDTDAIPSPHIPAATTRLRMLGRAIIVDDIDSVRELTNNICVVDVAGHNAIVWPLSLRKYVTTLVLLASMCNRASILCLLLNRFGSMIDASFDALQLMLCSENVDTDTLQVLLNHNSNEARRTVADPSALLALLKSISPSSSLNLVVLRLLVSFYVCNDDNDEIIEYCNQLAFERGDLPLFELTTRTVPRHDQYGELFKNAVSNSNLMTMQTLLRRGLIHLTRQDSELICLAKHISIIEELLRQPHIDPSFNEQQALLTHVRAGHVDIVRRLMKDSRVGASEEIVTAYYWRHFAKHRVVDEAVGSDKNRFGNEAGDFDENRKMLWALQRSVLSKIVLPLIAFVDVKIYVLFDIVNQLPYMQDVEQNKKYKFLKRFLPGLEQ